jgi:hypothetical protein
MTPAPLRSGSSQYQSTLLSCAIGVDSDNAWDAYMPSQHGPNPEALVAMLVHVLSNETEAVLPKMFAESIRSALQQAEFVETMRPTLLVLEPLALFLDDASSFETRFITLFSPLWHAFNDTHTSRSPDLTTVDKAFELAYFITRLTILSPRAQSYFFQVSPSEPCFCACNFLYLVLTPLCRMMALVNSLRMRAGKSPFTRTMVSTLSHLLRRPYSMQLRTTSSLHRLMPLYRQN